MVTKEDLESQLKDAMRSGDELQKSSIRMILTSSKLVEVDQGSPITEEQLLDVIAGEARARQESLDEAREFGRDDLAGKAEAELVVLQSYLPEQLSDEELKTLAKESIEETGAKDVSEMGGVMRTMMPKVEGRADGKRVSQAVRKLLS